MLSAKRLYESDAINTQFLHFMYCEEYEKKLDRRDDAKAYNQWQGGASGRYH